MKNSEILQHFQIAYNHRIKSIRRDVELNLECVAHDEIEQLNQICHLAFQFGLNFPTSWELKQLGGVLF